MIRRRQFLVWAASLVPVAALVRGAHAASIAELSAAPETLDALGLAILPGELGEAQIRRVVASFRRWLDEYREGAELLHAYGGSRLSFAGPTPATRYATQLDALESAARSAHNRAFAALTLDERRAMARAALTAQQGTGIPSAERAAHVAGGLLGFFYATPAATDLCYEAAIGRNTCRPLSESPRRPVARPSPAGGRELPTHSSIEGGS